LEQQSEQTDSDSPIIDEFIELAGEESIQTMTNFKYDEFLILYAVVQKDMVVEWITGHEKKTTTKPKDAFFMSLTVLKYFDTWAKHANDFAMNTSTFEKLVMKVFQTISPMDQDS
jgi:hypothetical protein